MNRAEIEFLFDRLIEFPDASNCITVTANSALWFAEQIARLATSAERMRCAQIADAHASCEGIAQVIAAEIRGQA